MQQDAGGAWKSHNLDFRSKSGIQYTPSDRGQHDGGESILLPDFTPILGIRNARDYFFLNDPEFRQEIS